MTTRLAVVLTCAALTATGAAQDDARERIVFNTSRDGQRELYSMLPDGSGKRRLTFDGVRKGDAAWSPTGDEIAFYAEIDGDPEIFVWDPTGEPRRLTVRPGEDAAPAWSPDGRTLAFEGEVDGQYDIFLIDRDGTRLRVLVDGPHNDMRPHWSPDGERIAFQSDRSGNDDVYVVELDDNSIDRLTRHEAADYQPKFSPDGHRIVFGSERGGTPGLWLLDLETKSVISLVDPPAPQWANAPSWSPDGGSIAFGGGLEDPENADIYIYVLETKRIDRLTTHSEYDAYPAWGRLPADQAHEGTWD